MFHEWRKHRISLLYTLHFLSFWIIPLLLKMVFIHVSIDLDIRVDRSSTGDQWKYLKYVSLQWKNKFLQWQFRFKNENKHFISSMFINISFMSKLTVLFVIIGFCSLSTCFSSQCLISKLKLTTYSTYISKIVYSLTVVSVISNMNKLNHYAFITLCNTVQAKFIKFWHLHNLWTTLLMWEKLSTKITVPCVINSCDGHIFVKKKELRRH